MDVQKTTQYFELLEENLNLVQQRQKYLQKVQNSNGKHKPDSYMRNIQVLGTLIKENNEKLKKIKERKT